MKKSEKIGSAILIILIIILAINVFAGQKTAGLNGKINCETSCHQIGNAIWTFPGAGPVSKISFQAKEDCISACQAKLQR